nr:hypothetical protein [Serratia marcescens]
MMNPGEALTPAGCPMTASSQYKIDTTHPSHKGNYAMDKQEYRLYLAMLKARGDLARKEMADNARRRNLIKAHRQRRSDDIRSLLAWKNRDMSVDGLLASDDELDARERAFGK